MRRLVIFNYKSLFLRDIEKAIQRHNLLFPERAFLAQVYQAEYCPLESLAGPADMIVHSGGDGIPVKEDASNTPKLYICYSHEWKAEMGGGKVVRLKGLVKGIRHIDILEDDEILGKRGRMPIMKYHELGVAAAPPCAKILATSKVQAADGENIEIIEALRYPDGSLSIQGHPEEGAAVHMFYNFFERTSGCFTKVVEV